MPAEIDVLLNLVPVYPDRVAAHLTKHPDIAKQADDNGYSLVHAAASYGHIDLLRDVVTTHGANVDMVDADGETALYMAETVEVDQCLVEELGANHQHTNNDGLTARQRIEEEAEWPQLIVWLRGKEGLGPLEDVQIATQGNGLQNGNHTDSANSHSQNTSSSTTDIPVHVPGLEGQNITFSLIDSSGEPPSEADTELRQRIQQLADQDNFSSPETQEELRRLIVGAISDISAEANGSGGEPAAKRTR